MNSESKESNKPSSQKDWEDIQARYKSESARATVEVGQEIAVGLHQGLIYVALAILIGLTLHGL